MQDPDELKSISSLQKSIEEHHTEARRLERLSISEPDKSYARIMATGIRMNAISDLRRGILSIQLLGELELLGLLGVSKQLEKRLRQMREKAEQWVW